MGYVILTGMHRSADSVAAAIPADHRRGRPPASRLQGQSAAYQNLLHTVRIQTLARNSRQNIHVQPEPISSSPVAHSTGVGSMDFLFEYQVKT